MPRERTHIQLRDRAELVGMGQQTLRDYGKLRTEEEERKKKRGEMRWIECCHPSSPQSLSLCSGDFTSDKCTHILYITGYIVRKVCIPYYIGAIYRDKTFEIRCCGTLCVERKRIG